MGLVPSREEAAAAWLEQIEASHAQMKRLADEVQHGTEEFLAARLPSLRAGASPSEELDYLRSLARPEDVWMELGAAAGRLAVPLAPCVKTFVALDPSPKMREALRETAERAGVSNLEQVDASWPDAAESLPAADVTLAANMFYAMERPLPFVDAMERRARRLCVITAADRPGRSPDPDVWREVMGEPHLSDPGAVEMQVLLLATGRRPDVRCFAAPPPRALPPEQAVEQQRWRLGLAADSARLPALRAAVEKRTGADGLVRLNSGRRYTAVLTWESS